MTAQAERRRIAVATRDKWAAARPWCDRCGQKATDTHEILRGTYRQTAMLHPEACCLRLCRACHEEVQDWPLARQAALKGLVETFAPNAVVVLYSLRFPNMSLGNFVSELRKVDEYASDQLAGGDA